MDEKLTTSTRGKNHKEKELKLQMNNINYKETNLKK